MFTFNKKNLFAYLCLAIALIALIFAVVTFSTDVHRNSGSYESSETYGGDAYTGIQNAAAQTANNVYYMNKNLVALGTCIATTGGFFFLLVAMTFALIGVKELGLLNEAPAQEVVEVAAAPEAEAVEEA